MRTMSRSFAPLAVAIAMTTLSGCRNSDISVDECLDDAAASISDNSLHHAQATCNHLLEMVNGSDSVKVDDGQAARLAILFMKLSEHQNEYENVADAVECLRYAFRHSTDSLNTFSASLQPEDERHFVLLRSIGMTIDNPVDLSERDMPDDFN